MINGAIDILLGLLATRHYLEIRGKMAPYIYHKHGWSLSTDLRNQPILKQTTHKVTEEFSLKMQQRLFDSGSINQNSFIT